MDGCGFWVWAEDEFGYGCWVNLSIFFVCNCLAGCIWVNILRVNMLALCLDAKKILERKIWVCDGFLTAEEHVTGSEMSLDYYYYFFFRIRWVWI